MRDFLGYNRMRYGHEIWNKRDRRRDPTEKYMRYHFGRDIGAKVVYRGVGKRPNDPNL